MKSENKKDYLIRFELVIILLLAIALIAPHINYFEKEPANPASPEMVMTLKTFEVPASEPVPTIAFSFDKDAMDGYDVHISTTNFTFTPEKINTAPVAGEGHVHLYVDDKLYVVFGPWFHVDDLPVGTHTIKASLNNNDHSIYTLDGNYIEATTTINVK